MAYDSIAQDKAFALYLRGLSLLDVHKHMAREYPGIAPRTIEVWAKAQHWKERRDEADARVRAFVDQLGDGRNLAMAMLMDLENIRQRHVKMLEASEEADAQQIYALTATVKQQAALLEQFVNRTPERVATAVLKSAMETLIAGMRELDGGDTWFAKHAAKIGQLATVVVERHGKA